MAWFSSNTKEKTFAIHDGIDSSYIGVLTVVALSGGIIFRTLFRRIHIPFTVLCLSLGLFLGGLMIWTDNQLGALGNSINNWHRLHPNTILVIFLPALIFESASSIDFHVFSKALSQTLLLAVPGVIINVVLICLTAYYLFPYAWSFKSCLVFGAMLSATDPVAVVALLKELGAPTSLSTIIEGESLLNDGVAFVLFIFLTGTLKGADASVGAFVEEFFYASGVGTVIGLALGICTINISGALFEDNVSQIMLTIVGAFGTFFMADGILEASGVLALVVFGLCYASFRHGGISSRSNEALEQIWEALTFTANTVIFVYSGFTIVYTINVNGKRDVDITARDYGYLVLLYVLLNIIRAISIAILYPFLKYTGYGINLKWAIVMSWGGLRGAVGLALGLILFNDDKIQDDFSVKAMFFMSGIVALTLILNAVTCGPLVRYLGLNRQSEAAKLFYVNAVKLINEHIQEFTTELHRSTRYRGADWDRVWKQLPALDQEMKLSAESQLGYQLLQTPRIQHQASYKESDDDCEIAVEDHEEDHFYRDARIRFLNLVKSSYHRDFQEGSVTSKNYMGILIDSATAAQEKADIKLCDWEELKKFCEIPSWYENLRPRCLRHFLSIQRISLAYQIATAFLTAHETVVPFFKSLVSNRTILRRIESENDLQLHSASKLLHDLEEQYPDVTRTVKTRQLIELILNSITTTTEELVHKGEIEEKDFESIKLGIDRSRSNMWLKKFKVTNPDDRKNVFFHSELFIMLTNEEIDYIYSISNDRVFVKGEIIQEKNGSKGLYVIAHGTVNVVCGERLFRLSYGNVVNALSSVTDAPLLLKYEAICDVRAFFIKAADVQKLLLKYKGKAFERNLYFRASVEAAVMQHDEQVEALARNPWNVGLAMSKGEVVHPLNSKPIEGSGGVGILFAGEITKIGEETYLENPKKPITIFKLDSAVTFRRNAVYLHIPQSCLWMLDSYHRVPSVLGRRMSTAQGGKGGNPRTNQLLGSASVRNLRLPQKNSF